jgi:hypothetical protein
MARILSNGTIGIGINAFGLSLVLILSLGSRTGVARPSSWDMFRMDGVDGADLEVKWGDLKFREEVGSWTRVLMTTLEVVDGVVHGEEMRLGENAHEDMLELEPYLSKQLPLLDRLDCLYQLGTLSFCRDLLIRSSWADGTRCRLSLFGEASKLTSSRFVSSVHKLFDFSCCRWEKRPLPLDAGGSK